MAQQRYSSGLRTPKTKGVGQKAKYKAVPTLIDGHKFPSKVEAKRYVELKRQRDLGIISGLKLQPRFKLLQDGKKTLCTYIADFQYDRDGETVIEDVKGVRTDVYVIKRKMMKALLGLVSRIGVGEQKVLVLTDGVKPNVFLSGRNLPNVHVMPYSDVSTYHLLWSDIVLIEGPADATDLIDVLVDPAPPPRRSASPVTRCTSGRSVSASSISRPITFFPVTGRSLGGWTTKRVRWGSTVDRSWQASKPCAPLADPT